MAIYSRPLIQNTYKILIVGGSGLGNTNVLLNLINNHPDIDKIYLYAKDTYEAKYQYLIDKMDHFNDPKAFMNIQLICKMYTKILKIPIQTKKEKY